jgi:hypothetical protein
MATYSEVNTHINTVNYDFLKALKDGDLKLGDGKRVKSINGVIRYLIEYWLNSSPVDRHILIINKSFGFQVPGYPMNWDQEIPMGEKPSFISLDEYVNVQEPETDTTPVIPHIIIRPDQKIIVKKEKDDTLDTPEEEFFDPRGNVSYSDGDDDTVISDTDYLNPLDDVLNPLDDDEGTDTPYPDDTDTSHPDLFEDVPEEETELIELKHDDITRRGK